ncbi:MAG: SDR family oxidoreductase [Bacteroidales bacterium]|nr:SDR family oxidoreductase [Bacteroidales bacterium]
MRAEKVLITGCGGMLGKSVYKEFILKYTDVLATDIDLNEEWLSYMDVRDIQNCEKIFEQFKPDIVLHLAALTDLEYCETNQNDSWLTNALGTENISILSDKYNAELIYISTAGIFDGEKEYFNDFDRPNPLSIYAKSKYHGEVFVQQTVARYYIFRAGWMMGGGIEKDKKFIGKIFRQIFNGNKELFVVDDKLGTPTYTANFALGIYNTIQTGYYGLYNQVCKGSCSRLDVAKLFIEYLGIKDEIKITKVNSDYFSEEYFAPRPYSEKLVNLKLEARKINSMKDWKVCLKEYTDEFKSYLENN